VTPPAHFADHGDYPGSWEAGRFFRGLPRPEERSLPPHRNLESVSVGTTQGALHGWTLPQADQADKLWLEVYPGILLVTRTLYWPG